MKLEYVCGVQGFIMISDLLGDEMSLWLASYGVSKDKACPCRLYHDSVGRTEKYGDMDFFFFFFFFFFF